MQGNIVMSVDPALIQKLDALTAAVERMTAAMQATDNSWKTASAFCGAHKISASTLARRVDDGAVEVQDLGPRTKRYRWKDGAR